MSPPVDENTATRPVRVAFVLHVMQVAGAEVLVFEIIQRLRSCIDPHVFCLDGVGPLGEQLIAEGVPVVAFDRRPGVDWRLIPQMSREIRSRRIDVIHAHQYTPFFYSSLAARLSRPLPRVIFTEHGRHFPDVVSSRRRFVNRLLFERLADEVTAVCDFSARALADNDGFSKARIKVIPNGITLDRYTPVDDRAGLRGRLGLAPDRRYVTVVARFHPVKDHATLLRAFQAVARATHDVDLLLVGDGPLRGVLEQQAHALGIAPRVHMVGVQSNVPDWLRASDIFTLCSVSEAASITLLEAMACGLPCVVTAVGGNPELVRDGQDGLLVARGDAQGLGSAILRLLADPDTRAKMGRSGRQRVEDEFLLETTIGRYSALYGANTGP
jgi:glycosyltransferase involved in cell wall biosynthesis